MQNFRKDILWSITSSFFVSAVSSIGGILIARALGPAGRGEYAIIILWPSLCTSLGNLGLPHASAYYTSRDQRDQDSIITGSVTIALIQGFLLSVIGYVALPHILSQTRTEVVRLTQIYLLFSTPIDILSGSLGGVLQGAFFIKEYNQKRILFSLLYTGFITLLFIIKRADLALFTFSLILAHWISLIYVLNCIYKKTRPSFNFDLRKTKSLITYGLKTQFDGTANFVNQRLDQLLISLFLDPEKLGLYAVAVAISKMIYPIANGISIVTLTWVTNLASVEDMNARDVLACVIRFTLLSMAVVGLLMIILIPFITSLLFGSGYERAILPSQILVVGTIFLGINLVFKEGFRSFNYPVVPAYSELISAFATIIFISLFLPLFDIVGAALASVFSYFIAVLFSLWFAKNRLKIPSRSILLPRLSDFFPNFRGISDIHNYLNKDQ